MIGVGIVGGFTILFINLWGNVFLGLVFFFNLPTKFWGEKF